MEPSPGFVESGQGGSAAGGPDGAPRGVSWGPLCHPLELVPAESAARLGQCFVKLVGWAGAGRGGPRWEWPAVREREDR